MGLVNIFILNLLVCLAVCFLKENKIINGLSWGEVMMFAFCMIVMVTLIGLYVKFGL